MSKFTKERLLNLFSGIDDEYIVEAEYTEEERARLTVAARAASAIAKEFVETSEQHRPTELLEKEDEKNDEELQAQPEAIRKKTASKVLRITFGFALAAAVILALLLLWNPDRSDVASTTSSAEQEETTPVDSTEEEDFIDVKELREVPIDSEHFPDALFREFIRTRYDSNKDGILDPAEILAVKEIRLYKTDGSPMEVEDLSGVEYFPALKVLECPAYELTRLDVSKNTFLRELNCSNTQLTELDVSKNTELKKLECDYTNIFELDLSHNPSLEELNLHGTQLNSIDLSKNPGLKYLDISYTPMIELDISQNAALEKLVAIGTQCTQIDISGNPALKGITASVSKLEHLDISNNPALESVIVTPTTIVTGAEGRENIIEKLDVSQPLR